MWDYLTNHWMSLAVAAYGILNIINGLLPDSPEKVWVGRILNFFSFLTRSDAPGTLKMPLTHGGTKMKMVNVWLPFMVAAMVLNGCAYCRQAANQSTTACKSWSALKQCGPKALDIAAMAMPYLISGDYSGALAILETQAGSEAACIMAVWESQMSAAQRAAWDSAKAARKAKK